MVDNLFYLKEADRKVLCIPKILIKGWCAREIVIPEAHSLLAHLGVSKTLDYLHDHVWWKDIIADTKAYCKTCHTCKTSKPSNQKPYGLLNLLSVPNYPWESIGMDFVGPLPESGNHDGIYDSITVVICLLTSMVYLIPSQTNYNAPQLAELMFEHIYKLHGLPKNIISDCNVLFTSSFWDRLHKLLGTKLCMSSAYHPSPMARPSVPTVPSLKCCSSAFIQIRETGSFNSQLSNLPSIQPGQQVLAMLLSS